MAFGAAKTQGHFREFGAPAKEFRERVREDLPGVATFAATDVQDALAEVVGEFVTCAQGGAWRAPIFYSQRRASIQ